MKRTKVTVNDISWLVIEAQKCDLSEGEGGFVSDVEYHLERDGYLESALAKDDLDALVSLLKDHRHPLRKTE